MIAAPEWPKWLAVFLGGGLWLYFVGVLLTSAGD